MIVREFQPKSKKDIVRIKITETERKKIGGSVVINLIKSRSKNNVKVSFGLCDLKSMIKEFEKGRSKLRK